MIPLAEQLRPTSLDTYIGQQHLVGKDAVLRSLIESGRIPSMIVHTEVHGLLAQWSDEVAPAADVAGVVHHGQVGQPTR